VGWRKAFVAGKRRRVVAVAAEEDGAGIGRIRLRCIPDVDHHQARLQITLSGKGRPSASQMKLKARIVPLAMERKDEFVAEKDLDVAQLPQEFETELVVALSNVTLWSPETPHLYAAEVALLEDGRILDIQQVKFGMRKMECTNSGLKLNGRPY
jgi:beta-galactosidase/beta-glucuronidase